jgi:hypothetical protein
VCPRFTDADHELERITLNSLATASTRGGDGKPVGACFQVWKPHEDRLSRVRWVHVNQGRPAISTPLTTQPLYLDAANGILWDDDSQIIKLHLSKMYSGKPGYILIIEANP